MARTLSAAMLAAQIADSSSPYIRLNFISRDGLTTYNYSGRLVQLEHHEEPYNDYATIDLYNNDLVIGYGGSKVDLRGYHVFIGYGYTTGNAVAEPNGDGSTHEYSYTSCLWVKSQLMVSSQGILVARLSLHGVWRMLQEQLMIVGTPPLYNDTDYTADTVYQILEHIIEDATGVLRSATGLTTTLSDLGTQDDGIINTFMPQKGFNGLTPGMIESIATVLSDLMAMTKCYLRTEYNYNFRVVFPQTSDVTDESYYSNQQFLFQEYTEALNLNIPNHIIVYSNQSPDGTWDSYLTGEAYSTDDFSTLAPPYDGPYMEVKAIYPAPEITNQIDTNNRALAILSKFQAETISGRLLIHHDARVELYDRVAVFDSRGS